MAQRTVLLPLLSGKVCLPLFSSTDSRVSHGTRRAGSTLTKYILPILSVSGRKIQADLKTAYGRTRIFYQTGLKKSRAKPFWAGKTAEAADRSSKGVFLL